MALDLRLSGQVAIVTGASRGLGKAIATLLTQQDVSVLGVARNGDVLDEIEAGSSGRFRGCALDLRDRAPRSRVVDRALTAYGRLDILVNNAAIAPAADFLAVEDDRWDEVVEMNLTVPADLVRAAGRYFTERGSGKMVNVASVVGGVLGKPGRAPYAATKAGVVALTRSLAAEWGGLGVQVNAVAPGALMTELRAEFEPIEDQRQRLALIPTGRFGQLGDAASLVVYLASPLADFVNGALIVFDGGETSTYHAPRKDWKPAWA